VRRAAWLAIAAAACGGGAHQEAKPAKPARVPVPVTAVPLAPPARDYPAARRDDVVDQLHGTAVHDPYRWLEDATKPDVQQWMKAEDDYARAHLGALPGRAAVAARLGELLRRDEIGVPVERHGRLFYEKRQKDKDKRIVYWRDGDKGAEHVLLDPNAWSTDGSAGLSAWFPSWDGKRVAFNVSLHGADAATMKIIDVASGKELADQIPGTGYGEASWTPDGKGFYYTYVPDPGEHVAVADRPGLGELRHHTLGDDPAKDAIAHEATHDPTTDLFGWVSEDGRWLFTAISHGDVSTEVYFRDARDPKAAWTTLVKGVDATYDLTVYKDRFYVLTNDGAPRFRVMRVDPKHPARADWKELVPAGDATIDLATIVGGKLLLRRLRDGAHELELRDLDGTHPTPVAVPALGEIGQVSGRHEADAVYLSYSSFTQPDVVYRASAKTGAIATWAQTTIPVDTSRWVADRVQYPSKDGTQVTMFVVHDKDAAKDGTHPTLLSGYGGFALSYPPSFSSNVTLWLEHGGVYAWADLRGGNENGEDWHRHGMLLEKQHVFDDFIAAAEYLEHDGWTSPARLAIWGGSNGGLLMGAAMTQRPELFKAVVCSRPLLDMLRYQRFGWGATWINEYGSADDAAQFAALYAYSPYHHVSVGVPYPALLMLSSDSDDRVDPLHARKFVAEVQWATASDAPVWLRIEKNAGHFGADVIAQQIEEGADRFAFLAAELGMK
jgi:prolyl oligopeptidase